MSYCPFCKEFQLGYPPFWRSGESRILHETEHFIVLPSVGQIVEGYLLILSKVHYISIGGVPVDLYGELEELLSKVKRVLVEAYGTSVVFEHGPSSEEELGGCCLVHAHLHIVPAPTHVSAIEELSTIFPGKQASSFAPLSMLHQQGIPYLLWENADSCRYVFRINRPIPSQHLRKVVAEKLEVPDRWDWREHLGYDKMRATIETLKGKF